MTQLPESERRQSVLNKMIFDYVQPSCGLWLLFCISREEEYREYTASTLQLATDSRKMCLAPRRYFFVSDKTPVGTPETRTPDTPDDRSYGYNVWQERFERCSILVEKRLEKIADHFQKYADAVHRPDDNVRSTRHLHTLRRIIERGPRENRCEEESNVSCNGKEGHIGELQKKLAAEQQARATTSSMLTTAQQALETLFAENVELEDDFFDVIHSATTYLHQLEDENVGLKEAIVKLCDGKNTSPHKLDAKNAGLKRCSDSIDFGWTGPLPKAMVRTRSLSARRRKPDSKHERPKSAGPVMREPIDGDAARGAGFRRLRSSTDIPEAKIKPRSFNDIPLLNMPSTGNALSQHEDSRNTRTGNALSQQEDSSRLRQRLEPQSHERRLNRGPSDIDRPQRPQFTLNNSLRARAQDSGKPGSEYSDSESDALSCQGIRARFLSVSENLKRLQQKAMNAIAQNQ